MSRADLSRAVALGAVAFNVARAIGPAIAGAIAAWIGTGSALLASAFCFIPMVLAIRGWQVRDIKLPGVPETVLSGVMSGLRFARHSPAMRAFVIRNLTFAVCASAFWALLPVIARDQLGLCAGGFGLLSAAFGIGAVTGALNIPGQMQRKSLNSIVKSGVILWTVATLLIAATVHTSLALIGAFGAGMAWVTVFASLSAGTQSSAPAWVRARAVGMNLVAVQAMIALGSAVWGAVAVEHRHTHRAGRIRGSHAAAVSRQSPRARADGQRGGHHAEPHLAELAPTVQPLPDDGPVLIQIEYQIDPSQAARIPARDPGGRRHPKAQRRRELARLSRHRRRRPLRRAVRADVVVGVHAPAHAHDGVATACCRSASRRCKARARRCACRA